MRRSYALLFLSLITTLFVSALIYKNVEWYFNYSLKKRVRAIAVTAAIQFEPAKLDKINSLEDINSKEYRDTVHDLQKIRYVNENIRFVYIQRKTEDPFLLKFVADADSIDPQAKIDINLDGVIDDEDSLNYPGQEYDVSDYPEFAEIAFTTPYVDDELSVDQWGAHLSATAPIFDFAFGDSKYIVGIDVDVSDFSRITRIAFVPFLLFISLLMLVLAFLTQTLVKMWGNQIVLLEELDRQKDELIGIVSHQLAKPITAIKWTLESMLDGDTGNLNTGQKESALTMQTMAVNLADLVSMILDVSRIQLGRVQLDPQPLDLNAFFKEIIDVIEPTVAQKKINFIKNISPTVLPTVLLDRRYTRMTVENLLTNAVKYTPEGGTVTLDVNVKDGVFSCSVKDTGCGIPKADQSKIFGKMFRASNVRNTVDGNGFGLYVAKGAVEGQGGEMSFESTEGKGTRFWFKMPAKLPEKK